MNVQHITVTSAELEYDITICIDDEPAPQYASLISEAWQAAVNKAKEVYDRAIEREASEKDVEVAIKMAKHAIWDALKREGIKVIA